MVGNETAKPTLGSVGKIDIVGQPLESGTAVTLEAGRIAAMIEAPMDPDDPRYDNFIPDGVSDLLIRAVRGERGAMSFKELKDGVKAAERYVSAVTDERDAKSRKANAAAYLTGMARRLPWFRGFGFPESNTTATVVETTKKRLIKPENVAEVVMQAGKEINDIANHSLNVNIPLKDLKDRRGRAITAEAMQEKLEAFLEKTLHPDNHGRAGFTQTLSDINWKRIAQLLRRGKISPELITIERDFIVKPISLHPTPDKKAPDVDVQSS